MKWSRMAAVPACLSVVLAACESQDHTSRVPTAAPQAAARTEKMTPEQLRRIAGVDRLPAPADVGAMQASMRRHWPTDPQAVGASATVDVSVDATGRVTAVTPAPTGARGASSARMILEERDGSQRVREVRRAASALPAAQAVLRDVQFAPALRDGRPVAHTFRMTISFTPDALEAQ